MSDLIKRSDAIEAIEETDWYHINRDGDLVSGARSDGTALYKAGDVYKALEAVPSARPNGEWIWHEDDDICNCSECEFEIDATGCIEPMEYVGVFRYCPNCGAHMKGAENNKECHKPESLYYRAFCEERKDSAYCDGCEFWY